MKRKHQSKLISSTYAIINVKQTLFFKVKFHILNRSVELLNSISDSPVIPMVCTASVNTLS